MTESDFVPKNPLEEKLVEAQNGRLPIRDLINYLLNVDVFIPTASIVEPTGEGFVPMVFERDGEELIAVFTAIERVDRYREKFQFCLSMSGAKLVSWMPQQYGIVVNPGYRVGIEIPANGVREICQEFVPPPEE
jgi:hypothetical protein